MDLRTAHGAFNFLTSLIQYEGAWTERDVYGLPFIEEEPRQPRTRRGVLSIILHELTHLASFHTTRLGWITHEAASNLLKQWTHDESPVLSGMTAQIIGTMVPVLEGLAMYAQLDLDVVDSPQTLHSVPKFYACAATSVSGVPTSAVLRAARLSQVEAFDDDEGLLHLLYQDTGSPINNQNLYLVGYLWVKAVAASLGRRCPALAPADVMLPLLIRILCDHPAMIRAQRGEIEVDSLLPTIQQSITNWSTASLDRLADLLHDDATKDRISHLHVADFLDGEGKEDSYAEDTFPAFARGLAHLDDEGLRWYAVVMASASFHFTSRSQGTVRSVDEDGHRIVLDSGGTEVLIVTAPIGNLWALYAENGADTERLARTRSLAIDCEHSVFRFASEATGLVTIAKFFGLSSPHDSGIVIWDHDGKRSTHMSFVPEALDNQEHNARLQVAFSFSVEQRLGFAKALTAGKDFRASSTAAVEILLETLVSSPHMRSAVSKHGFASALPADNLVELDKWCTVHVLALPHTPSEDLLRGVASVVDFPGFAGKTSDEQVVVGDLFPTIR